MTTTATTYEVFPCRYDFVGSFLRPAKLKDARLAFQNHQITQEELTKTEDECIRDLVEHELALGLRDVTDGEFRRSWWHFDFLENLNGIEGYVPEKALVFHDIEVRPYKVHNTGKISFNPEHPFLAHFRFLNEVTAGRARAKFTIPSPNQLLRDNARNESIYPTWESYCHDIQEAYKAAILAFYEAGCRYLQIDDTYWAYLITIQDQPEFAEMKKHAADTLKAILAAKPADMIITTHICRGNYRSTYSYSGAYDAVAEDLFAVPYDGFFLEYDSDRSGSFEALSQYKGNKRIVLGLITSKTPELEDRDYIKARIDEASQYVPREQLCLSPQCGFSSTEEGNNLTEDQQWAKLAWVKQLAEELLDK